MFNPAKNIVKICQRPDNATTTTKMLPLISSHNKIEKGNKKPNYSEHMKLITTPFRWINLLFSYMLFNFLEYVSLSNTYLLLRSLSTSPGDNWNDINFAWTSNAKPYLGCWKISLKNYHKPFVTIIENELWAKLKFRIHVTSSVLWPMKILFVLR